MANSLKVFCSKSRYEKLICFWKKTKSFFCTRVLLFAGNCWNFLAQNFYKKCSGSKKKVGEPRKSYNVVSHIFNALSKTLSKYFLPRPKKVKITIQKKPESLGKIPRCPLHTTKKRSFLRRSFAHSLKVFCSKSLFVFGKKTKWFFCTRFLPFWEHCRVFLAQTSNKNWQRSKKKVEEPKKTRTLSPTTSMHFRKHCWKLFCRSPKNLNSQSKKTLNPW